MGGKQPWEHLHCSPRDNVSFFHKRKKMGLGGDVPEEPFLEQAVKAAAAEIAPCGQLTRF